MRQDLQMPPRRHLLASTLLLPVLLTACSGGSDEKTADPTATVGTLSASTSAARAQYAQAANGVCTRAVAAAKLIPQPRTNAEVVSAVKLTLAVGEEGLKGLNALTPPAEDLVSLKTAFLEPLAKQVTAFQTVIPKYEAAAASADPTAAFGKIADPGASVTVNLEYIEKYGMPSCAVFAGKR